MTDINFIQLIFSVISLLLGIKYIYMMNSLLMFDNDTITINKDCFVGCMKDLYCPKKFDPDTLSFDQVRDLTIGKMSSVSITGQTTKDPKRWLPPESAIRRLADIVQLQIDYLLIAGFHEKELPDLSSRLPWQRLSGEKRWPH